MAIVDVTFVGVFLSLTVDRLTGFEVRFLSIICFFFFSEHFVFFQLLCFQRIRLLIGTLHKLMNIHFHVNFTHG